MRTPVDALQSVRLYAYLALGEDWEVRLTSEEGAFRRPFCRVNTTTPATIVHHNAFQFAYRQTFGLVCYPVEKYTPDEARVEAARVQDVLVMSFAQGVLASAYGPTQNATATEKWQRAHPRRIPLWDFDGVGLDDPIPMEQRDSRDFMHMLEDPSVDIVVDPAEPLLYTVVAYMRMSWGRSAAVLSPGVTTRTVEAEPNG